MLMKLPGVLLRDYSFDGKWFLFISSNYEVCWYMYLDEFHEFELTWASGDNTPMTLPSRRGQRGERLGRDAFSKLMYT